jgi:tetratricopeptide (TPR) repeat protein
MHDMAVDQLYRQALQCQQSGRLAEAQALCRQVLALEPRHAEAWHTLAGLAHQSGGGAAALQCVQRAIDANPTAAVYHASHGVILTALGQSDAAIEAYREALRLDPSFAGAHANLGNLFKEKGQWQQAIQAYRQALSLRPDHPPTLHNLGLALRHEQKLSEAIETFARVVQLQPQMMDSRLQLSECLREAHRADEALAEARRALAMRPQSPAAQTSVGMALQECGRLEEAITEYRRAIALDPKYGAAYTNLGFALEVQGRSSEAVAVLRKAAELEPAVSAIHLNLGNSLTSLGQYEDAQKELEQAIALKTQGPEVFTNLGKLQTELGNFDDAIANFNRALALQPDFTMAMWNWANVLLLRGDFENGLPKFEARRQIEAFRSNTVSSGAMWDRQPLAGKQILLHQEHGFGDTIHLIRYARTLLERGASVGLLCHPALKRLLSGQCGLERVVDYGQALPPYDFHCPLSTLPLRLGTTLLSIPADVPYLFPEQPLLENWKALLGREPAGPKVGLVWAGNPKHLSDRDRSIELKAFEPLAAGFKAPRFYSLQTGPAAEQAKSPPAGMELVDWTDRLTDWAQMAALIECLDLVITVDTAVAHLAGAMGKPVWVLLAFLPDWRWMLEREDSPWYPTMRLFRQKTREDWSAPIGRVADELKRFSQMSSGDNLAK